MSLKLLFVKVIESILKKSVLFSLEELVGNMIYILKKKNLIDFQYFQWISGPFVNFIYSKTNLSRQKCFICSKWK